MKKSASGATVQVNILGLNYLLEIPIYTSGTKGSIVLNNEIYLKTI